MMDHSNLEIISFNVRGLGDEKKRKKVFHYLKKNTSSNSIIFLQECHSTTGTKNMWQHQWKDKMYFSHGTSNARGVCIAFRYGLEHKLLSDPITDSNGRYIILHIELQGLPYLFVNYYAPNRESDQVKVLREIKEKVGSLTLEEHVRHIWGGDWNMIFDTNLDAFGGHPTLKKRFCGTDDLYKISLFKVIVR